MKRRAWSVSVVVCVWSAAPPALGQHADHGASPPDSPPSREAAPAAKSPPGHGAQQERDSKHSPPLPEGASLEQTLDSAASGPPNSWPPPIHDNPTLSFTLFELLEYRLSDDKPDQLGWDIQGWIGNDDHKFWWKSDGDVSLSDSGESDADIQLLYAQPISPFWYLQAGIRYDRTWASDDSQDRASLVLGAQGLAPLKFDIEPALYLTDDGDVLANITASYDLYLTQRLVLQPRAEVNVSAQDVPDYGLGAGFNDVSLEFRLRYEFAREFAPYVGVRYTSLLGATADIGRRNGESVDNVQFVIGFRIAF
ncbi:MAG: copper resistance protein B [Phycisphaerales bacterium]